MYFYLCFSTCLFDKKGNKEKSLDQEHFFLGFAVCVLTSDLILDLTLTNFYNLVTIFPLDSNKKKLQLGLSQILKQLIRKKSSTARQDGI